MARPMPVDLVSRFDNNEDVLVLEFDGFVKLYAEHAKQIKKWLKKHDFKFQTVDKNVFKVEVK